MERVKARKPIEKDAILATLIELITEMTSDWEREFSGEIAPTTRLVSDLGCSSMDLVLLIVHIQQQYQRHDLPFEDLFAPNGRYVKDLCIADVANFLYEHFHP